MRAIIRSLKSGSVRLPRRRSSGEPEAAPAPIIIIEAGQQPTHQAATALILQTSSNRVHVQHSSPTTHDDLKAHDTDGASSVTQFTADSSSSRSSPSGQIGYDAPISQLNPACDLRPQDHPTEEQEENQTQTQQQKQNAICVHEVEVSTISTPPRSLPPTTKAPSAHDVNDQAISLLSFPAPSPAWTLAQSLFPNPNPNDALEIMQRKVWVRRPGASATLVVVSDDDLVDTVRDSILQKYANSLGRSIDSPDVTLKIISREPSNKSVPQERILSPDEAIGTTLDLYYPGGQTIDEALVIDVPQQRRTPKASPKVVTYPHPLAYPYYLEDHRPSEGGRDYFPPVLHSPHLPQHPGQPTGPPMPHSIGVLTTGQLPALPSPGGHSTRKHRDGRPKYIRQHTSSPTIMHSSQAHSNDLKSAIPNGVAPPAPLPTPPAQADHPHRPSITPPNRATSPHPSRTKRKFKQPQSAKSINGEPSSKPTHAGLLDANVPPINVLIVEDNIINLRLLEQFMKRLKVRWKTATNGREAVDTWRTGGFHLVLMDIQLPIMNGLEATKEIRRLESVNGIGLSVMGPQNARDKDNGELEIDEKDRLPDMKLFKSPVIIVALTASSLQSDRHEALAVGCNDFLTKPVGYPWMMRKVTEWGCMQALIDFDGWRQWKASAEKKDEGLSEEQKKVKEKEEKAKQKAALKAMFSKPPPSFKEKEKKEEPKNESGPKSPVNGNTSGPSRAIWGGRGTSGSGSLLETHAELTEE